MSAADGPLLECVPNFSEGRDDGAVRALAAALCSAGARLLDCGRDADHHRCVVTAAGTAAQLADGVLAAAAEAVRRIDLRAHRGVHRRMGALDVCPFVPLAATPMAAAVTAAEQVGERLGRELSLPVFLYGEAARRPERRVMSRIRNRQFEGLLALVGRDPAFAPDFGPPRLHPTAGAVAVGARRFLVAFNVALASSDVAVARAVAGAVRESGGGLPAVQALGFFLAGPGMAQVSMNLLDFTRTPPLAAFRRVRELARASGVEVAHSELIGLVPAAAIGPGDAEEMLLSGFDPQRHTVEGRLAATGPRGCGR